MRPTPSPAPSPARTQSPTAADRHDRPTPPAPHVRPGDTDRDTRAAVEHVLRAALQQRLEEAKGLDDTFSAELAARVADFALRGGKRLRASFAWWGWRAAGGAAEGEQAHGALRVAAALELIQTCALIHDDVMDRSPLRRGASAAHVDFAAQHAQYAQYVQSAQHAQHAPSDGEDFGRSAAILAGDLALVWADDLAVGAATEAGTWRRISGPWRAMRTEMVAGQYLDLRTKTVREGTPEDALHVACLKSALYTAERPLQLGSRMAGADPRTERALCAAARSAGLAFQLRDDLRDVFGDPGVTGKRSGEDVREGKLTYLVAVARRFAASSGDRAAAEVLAESVGNAGLSAFQLELFRETVTGNGAVTAVEAKIEELVAESLQQLGAAAVEPAAEQRLAALVRTAAGMADDGTPGHRAPGRGRPGHRAPGDRAPGNRAPGDRTPAQGTGGEGCRG